MVFPDSIEAVSPRVRVVIERFSSRYHDAMDALEARKYEEARELYVDLLRLYQEIQAADIDPLHMNIAYSCIEDLYNDLQHKVEVPVVSTTGLRIGISASILVILFGIFIITNPSFVGLTAMEFQDTGPSYWKGPNHLVLGGPYTLNLNDYVENAWDVTYLVTEGRGVNSFTDGPLLTLVPKRGFSGNSRVTIYGYNTGDKPQLLFKKDLGLVVSQR
ncbi:MAG: hypothetical protein ACE5FT_07440 [Candidatus Nanoarchaeia archaeon]